MKNILNMSSEVIVSGQLVVNPRDDVPEGGWGPVFCTFAVPAGGFFDGLVDIQSLFEWFSSSHTSVAYSQMLWDFVERVRIRACGKLLRVPLVVCDFSWSLIMAILRVFNDQSTR